MIIDRRKFLVASGATVGLAAVRPGVPGVGTSDLKVVDLKVEYIQRPLGLEESRPRLSWRLESTRRNVRQSAYRILVASSEEALKAGRGDLWDSDKIRSSRSFGIRYQGRRLVSRERCWWRVQVWDQSGQTGESREVSWWEMGLLDPKDWTAEWLAAEDPVTRADREAGLQWIWGEPLRKEPLARRFRFSFELPTIALAGELFAVVNDGLWTSHVSGIWIDGEVYRGDPSRRFSHNWQAVASDTLTGQRLPFGPLSVGRHLLAIEVRVDEALLASMRRALAVLARFILSNGEVVRLGGGSGWKCSSAHEHEEEPDWYMPDYRDGAWEAASPVVIEGFHPMPPAPAMHLRRAFTLNRLPVKARLYATALGSYEARLNSQRVGDAQLTPEIAQYAERVLYQVYEVGGMLRLGDNVLGLTVGDGWYGSWEGRYSWGSPPRRVLAQLELTFADGSRQVIATGPGWRIAESPIREAQIRVGEIYDARLEQLGWDGPPFDDTQWEEARMATTPSCRLVAQATPPIRVTQTLKPRAIFQPRLGIHVFDFGQNFAGWCRLKVKGQRGDRIDLKFAELLKSSGEIDEDRYDIGEPKRDVFILRGAAEAETFEPHFTYRGFRYVQVTGLAATPTLDSLEGRVVHSDLAITGQLRIADPQIQAIWRTTLWTQRSNFVGIPTDCPSREQRGWMGDVGIFWDAAAFNMDVCAFSARQMDNALDDQSQEGMFPAAAPEPRYSNSMFKAGGGPAWADGCIILAWTAWRRYGDLAIIERSWVAMNRYLDFIARHNPHYLWQNERGFDVGDDFYALDKTPRDLIATAYWAHSVRLLADMAEAIGRRQEAMRLHALFERIRRAFNDRFVKADGTVGTDSQDGYALALQFGLLPETVRQAAADRFAADVRRRGVALTTGILGTQFLLDVLTNTGFADLAYGLLLKTEYPSWGYMIGQGATTMWERWSGQEGDSGEVHRVSRNHFVLGSVCGFLFRRIAGIDAVTPGFETILIRPVLDPRLRRGGGDYDSVMGRISTDWRQTEEGDFTLHVVIPANASARIHLPARPHSRIEEEGAAVMHRRDIQLMHRDGEEAVIVVGSGTYDFVITDWQML